ncbi:MAG: hypothetical protein A3K19_22190 [Lentisphaerae bacterium RIFOXYB12_FULL_65_16]|nr:MAG: hypothetical protein A3K18_21380 [Lentisphaerae bacterium RIFOXYA12_64_32]OGV93572.1 MAG: hypothetical protein A3K19_22190 [Lentisphaerae bacterium RIFOXYB12_FULL_65_16]
MGTAASVIKVLIVDDDAMCRDGLRQALTGLADIEVIGVSPNGTLGLIKARRQAPDLVLVAASLTDVTPVDFTRAVLVDLAHTGILIAASDSPKDADATIPALEAGAYDFVVKPDGQCRKENIAAAQRLLVPKIRCFSIRRYSRLARRLTPTGRSNTDGASLNAAPEATGTPETQLGDIRGRNRNRIEAVLVGASTGGPEALSRLIPALPANLAAPVVIVLHMPGPFTARMAAALDRASALNVSEGADGDVLTPGHAYLAPGAQHLTVERNRNGALALRLLDGNTVSGCKPSVDLLFRSAAETLGGRCLAVVLTGMGSDGTCGLTALKAHHAPVLVQDEATSIVWGMPGSAVHAGLADEILPLDKIGPRVVDIVGSR